MWNPLSDSVLFTSIVSCMQLYRHIRSPPLIDIITAIDLHLFRSLLLSSSHFLWIVCSGARFITWIGNWTIKMRTIFSIVKSGSKTRHTYIFKIKGSRCYYYHHHQHHCQNTNLPQFLSSEPSPQWTKPSHTLSLVIHFPFGHFQWKLEHFHSAEQQRKWSPSVLRVNTFMVTAFVSLHFHTLCCLHCIHLSHHSFMYHFHHVHSPWESVLFIYIVSSIQCYCNIRSPPPVLHTSTL